jgi:hypothetical protein
MKFLSMITLATLLLTSCATQIHKSQDSAGMDVKVRSNLVADVEVDMTKKIQGSSTSQRLFGFIWFQRAKHYADGVSYSAHGHHGFFGPGIVEETKSAAAYKAITPGKVELIVAPQYSIKKTSYLFGAWTEVTANVSGYAGKIKNISAKGPGPR